MHEERFGFDVVLLGDGTVLAVGSDKSCEGGGAVEGSQTAEVYDAILDSWTDVESLNKARKAPATVGLTDGSAYVIGGLNSDDVPFSSTKVFRPSTRSWTDGPLLGRARGEPVAATTMDGRVLVISETMVAEGNWRSTAEVYDPVARRWTEATSLRPRLNLFELLPLAGGQVLGIGLDGTDSDPGPLALLYDPARDAWSPAHALSRARYRLVTLPDGRALAIGGSGGGELWGDTRKVVDAVSLFDPRSGRWESAAPLRTARHTFAATVLADGRVIVAGGTGLDASGSEVVLGSTEIYEPRADSWTSGPNLIEPRYGAHMVSLGDGSVLILGGSAEYDTMGETPFCPTPLRSTERYWP